MQITFMVELVVSLISLIKAKGFEIDCNDVTEHEVEVLTFQKANSNYTVYISAKNGKQGEYLTVGGIVRKENKWIPGFQIDPLVKELKSPNDGIVIDRTENGDVEVTLSKYFYVKFPMENVDKNATMALAKDILGEILRL